MTASTNSFPIEGLIRLSAAATGRVIVSVDCWRMFGYSGAPKYFTFLGRLFGGDRPKAQVFLSREMPILVLHAESKWAVRRFGPEVAAAFLAHVVETLFPVEPHKTNLQHQALSLSSNREARAVLARGVAEYCRRPPSEVLQVFETRMQKVVEQSDWLRLFMGSAAFTTSPDSIVPTFESNMERILEGKAVEGRPCPQDPPLVEFFALGLGWLAAYPDMAKEPEAGA